VKVVSDTGPIIALAKAGCLSILKELFIEVFVPTAVHKELFAKTGSEGEEIERALNDFIRVSKLGTLEEHVKLVLSDLDEGEKQAVGLASSMNEEVILLIDDKAGRQAADKLNIPVTGVVGILLLAKRKGLIKNVAEIIEKIRNNGYWLSDEVINAAKLYAGEE
jgi:predicted nucleic acid-binding protein